MDKRYSFHCKDEKAIDEFRKILVKHGAKWNSGVCFSEEIEKEQESFLGHCLFVLRCNHDKSINVQYNTTPESDRSDGDALRFSIKSKENIRDVDELMEDLNDIF